MAKANPHHFLLLLILQLCFVPHSHQLHPLQSQALLKIQQLLNYTAGVSSFRTTTDPCTIDPTPSLTIVCYEQNLTQLHVIGPIGSPPLPPHFSAHSLFDVLSSGLSSTLKVLTLASLGLWGPLPAGISQLASLEILNVSSNYFSGSLPPQLFLLRNLQSLILDSNNFTGEFPHQLTSLQALAVFSARNNSLGGPLPHSLACLNNLRVLALSRNNLSGEVPDLCNLTNLQVVDLEGNRLGPHFPSLHTFGIVSLVLRDNKFGFGIPKELLSYYQLHKLDISLNAFLGPFLPSLLSLPALQYLDVSRNKLTGRLLPNMSCNADIGFVNLTDNLLSGELPRCLQQSTTVLEYAGNCFSDDKQQQHPSDFCHNEALAVNVLPAAAPKKKTVKAVVASSLMGGIFGVTGIATLVFLVVRRNFGGLALTPSSTSMLICEKVSVVNTAKLLLNARHISETMKLGATLPAYRAFTLEEVKEVTKNFHASCLIYGSCNKKIHRGTLADGSVVAITSIKPRRRQSSQAYTDLIELISKFRHCHLVSALGHCFQYSGSDYSSVCVLHVIFEFVPNGTLRSWISGKDKSYQEKLDWKQRLTSVISVAKAIQFLNTGIVPGVFSNNIKITDVLLDQNLHVKIITSLPLLDDKTEMVGVGAYTSGARANASQMKCRSNHEDKDDMYDIGVILLEIMVGRSIISQNDILVAKEIVSSLFLIPEMFQENKQLELEVSFQMDEKGQKSILDPALFNQCSDESLKTAMTLCLRCLSSEAANRPSVEDVIWNLQFASQLQASWKVDQAAM